MSLASGLFFGLAPLWDVWRGDLERPLRAGGRTGRGGPHQRARSLLVVSEVALSVVLLIGAGLLIRTFVNLQRFNAGFQTDRVLTFRLALPAERYAESAPAFAGELERALRALPGVEAAGIVNQLPLDDDPNYAVRFWTRGHAADTDAVPLADARLISPGYFETLQSTLVAGRWFTDRDDETAPLAVIVDERLARRAWPGGNPVGQEIRLQSAEGPWGHVVGVVRHLRHHRLSEEVREEVFVPFQQWPRNQMGVVVRSSLDRAALMSAITLRIRDIDANLAPARVRPLQDLAARSRAPARFNMILAAVFAGFSLLLACLSLYSIISYSAAQRTPELGVRAALGATSGDLIKAVAGHGAVLTLVGITLGLSAAVVVASSLEAMLFGVTTFDPRTFTGVPLVVAGTALLACYLPARRAARVDPMIALRRE
jgi:predicted permease